MNLGEQFAREKDQWHHRRGPRDSDIIHIEKIVDSSLA